MGFVIFLVVVGTSMILWPELLMAPNRKQHAHRSAMLRAGEPERFFEERRSLETYPPSSGAVLWRRGLGGVMVAFGLGLLIFVYLPQWQQDHARKAAFDEAQQTVLASQAATSKVTAGDEKAYREAQTALERSEAAVSRSEQLGN